MVGLVARTVEAVSVRGLRCPLVCSALRACQRERGAFPEEARLHANEAVTDLRPVTRRAEEKRTNEEGGRRERAKSLERAKGPLEGLGQHRTGTGLMLMARF